TTTISFGDAPTPRFISDINGNRLDTAGTFMPAAVSTLNPTSAPASVSGRVTVAKGIGIRNSSLTLTESNGTTHTTLSDNQGRYRFTGIASGQTVIVSVRAGRSRFNPSSQVLNLVEDLTNVNFTAQGGGLIIP
ncbi:MAG TPA: carboxypeptidase-like regulatory domain-containing protein, partial [Pyrinomonadaceae bacterium]|nr:carboxypeptidase-like regulatory domain-containing protein [Pyrinomonadaceae bacterium]